MPAFTLRVLEDAEGILDDILDEHEELLDQAEGFGLRVGATRRAMAYPRGLMSLSEARVIVEGFDANTAKLGAFLDNLYRQWGSQVPPEFKADWDRLVGRAQGAYDKFETDRKKAQAALDRYEDLLVGEHFQAAFQALRLKVLDLDPSEDVQVKFETDLKLDADPAYAVGKVKIYRDSTHLYTVMVGYKAVDDSYWGNIHSGTKRHTFKSVVSKSGHTRLPRFVGDLVGQLQALVAAEGTDVFGSRRQAPKLTLRTPREIEGALNAPLRARLEKQKAIKDRGGAFNLSLSGSAFVLSLSAIGWQDRTVTSDNAKTLMSYPVRETVRPLLRAFDIRGTDGVTYAFAPELAELKFSTRLGYSTHPFTTWEELQELFLKFIPEYAARLPSIDVLRARAARVGVNVSDISRSKTDVAERIRRHTVSTRGQHFESFNWEIKIKLPFQAQSARAAAESMAHRVGSRFRLKQAGGCGFEEVVWVSDIKAAYREGVAEARREHGEHEGYGGSMHSKDGYSIRSSEPVPLSEAREAAYKDEDRNDKWGPSFARALSNPKVLSEERVTVTVSARNQAEAERKGRLLVEATGRIPPKATPLVEQLKVRAVGGGVRTKEWEVTGIRKLVLAGKVDGWLFYGIAPC